MILVGVWISVTEALWTTGVIWDVCGIGEERDVCDMGYKCGISS